MIGRAMLSEIFIDGIHVFLLPWFTLENKNPNSSVKSYEYHQAD